MNAPREVMRLVRSQGGRIEKVTTRFDAERGGRVLELVAFWPDHTGYDEQPDRRAGCGDDR